MAGDVPKGMPLCLSRSTSSERRALYGLFQRRHVKAGRFTGARRLSCYDEIRENYSTCNRRGGRLDSTQWGTDAGSPKNARR